MSHLSRVTSKMKDVETLRVAVESLGLELGGKCKVRIYDGSIVDVEHHIQFGGGDNGAQRVGFNRNADGSFEFVTDWYNVDRHISKKGLGVRSYGTDGQQFRENIQVAYGKQSVMEICRQKGYTLVDEEETNEGVRLMVQVGSGYGGGGDYSSSW